MLGDVEEPWGRKDTVTYVIMTFKVQNIHLLDPASPKFTFLAACHLRKVNLGVVLGYRRIPYGIRLMHRAARPSLPPPLRELRAETGRDLDFKNFAASGWKSPSELLGRAKLDTWRQQLFLHFL